MSVSHSKFSFPKMDRFPTLKRQYSDVFYDLPSTQSTRVTSLGYGTKYKFDNIKGIPGPGAYQTRILFHKKDNKDGFSMAVGRDKPEFDIGPGQHNIPSSNDSRAFSIRSRIAEKIRNDVPGPGHYPITPTITPKGKYSLSQLSNSRCTVIDPPHSQRFVDVSRNLFYSGEQRSMPGPGNYSIQIERDKGDYVLSQCKSNKTSKFAQRKRETFDKFNNNPGPGHYKINSIFQ